MNEAIVVMGVSGCGKTSTGQLLADFLGWSFKDADSLHPKQNVAKMSKGIPLTDDDRYPWLQDVNKYCLKNPHSVIACSALKYRYREILRNGLNCKFIFLNVSRSVLEQRVSSRHGHFMPASLLDSQLNTLEVPVGESDVFAVDCNNLTPKQVAEKAASWYSSQA